MTADALYLRRKRSEAIDAYAQVKRAHGRREGLPRKLLNLTTRLLRVEVAQAKAAARTRPVGTTLGDLDLFTNR